MGTTTSMRGGDDMRVAKCWGYAVERGVPDSNWQRSPKRWPLRNVHLGVSVDERIPLLLETPAAGVYAVAA